MHYVKLVCKRKLALSLIILGIPYVKLVCEMSFVIDQWRYTLCKTGLYNEFCPGSFEVYPV